MNNKFFDNKINYKIGNYFNNNNFINNIDN